MTKNRFDVLEKQARTLEEVAFKFPEGSPQRDAIRAAAFALVFAITEQYDSFVRYVNSSKQELSDEQKDHLRKLGITE
jgi:hypothetical protein